MSVDVVKYMEDNDEPLLFSLGKPKRQDAKMLDHVRLDGGLFYPAWASAPWGTP